MIVNKDIEKNIVVYLKTPSGIRSHPEATKKIQAFKNNYNKFESIYSLEDKLKEEVNLPLLKETNIEAVFNPWFNKAHYLMEGDVEQSSILEMATDLVGKDFSHNNTAIVVISPQVIDPDDIPFEDSIFQPDLELEKIDDLYKGYQFAEFMEDYPDIEKYRRQAEKRHWLWRLNGYMPVENFEDRNYDIENKQKPILGFDEGKLDEDFEVGRLVHPLDLVEFYRKYLPEAERYPVQIEDKIEHHPTFKKFLGVEIKRHSKPNLVRCYEIRNDVEWVSGLTRARWQNLCHGSIYDREGKRLGTEVDLRDVPPKVREWCAARQL